MTKELLQSLVLSFLIVIGTAFFFVPSSNAYVGSNWNANDFDQYTPGNNLPYYSTSTLTYDEPFFRISTNDAASWQDDANCWAGHCMKLAANATYSSTVRKFTKDNFIPEKPYVHRFRFKVSGVPAGNGATNIIIGNWSPPAGVNPYLQIDYYTNGDLYAGGTLYQAGFADSDWHTLEWKVDSTNIFYRIDDYAWSVKSYALSSATNNINVLNITADNVTSHAIYVDEFEKITQDPVGLDSPYWELTALYPDFSAPERNICFIGQDCDIEVRFNDRAVDGTLFFIYDNGENERFPEYASSSYLVTRTADYTMHLTEPQQGSTTEQKYCLYLQVDPYLGANEFGQYLGYYDKVMCGFYNVWVDEATYTADLDYIQGDVCDDVASSSGSFADDFRYGLECGARRIGYFFFHPSSNSYKKISDIKTTMDTVFPFSIYDQVTDAFAESTSTLESFTINFTELTGIPGYDTDLELAGESTMQSLGGFWNVFYSAMEMIIYILAFFFFGWELIRIMKQQ